MIKIESVTLEEAYQKAASALECSVTELKIEVIQYPKKGILGLFRKEAIIVATKDSENTPDFIKTQEPVKSKPEKKEKKVEQKKDKPAKKTKSPQKNRQENSQTIFNDTIMPQSFVSTQDHDEDEQHENNYFDSEKSSQAKSDEISVDVKKIAKTVKKDINKLFNLICFDIDEVEVSAYDENTLLVELKGEDAALLIGKEGYRYKALSYMIFNWINSKYQLQLRLEIAEFLKNQEESISRYLVGVCEGIDRDGRAQTKILDGVLVQIALKELREKYPEKYVAIRSTRDGMKYIIVNDYYSN